MFSRADPIRFKLTINDCKHELHVCAFKGEEAISTPYAFDVEFVCESRELDLDALLHKPAYLAFDQSGSGVHGFVYRIEQGPIGRRLSHYSLTLVPQITYLKHRINQRIFQRMNAEQIIAQVLKEHGILSNLYQFNLMSATPEREYCVQYNESDLHLIQRLCEEEGLSFYFTHSADEHVLMFSENDAGFLLLDGPVRFLQDSGMAPEHPVINRFTLRLENRTTRVTRHDYNFENPRYRLESEWKGDVRAPGPDLEDYAFPAGFEDRDRGRELAKRAQERHRSDHRLASGSSDERRLVSGHFLTLADHPREAWNDLWLLTQVNHVGKQPQALEEFGGGGHDPDQGYSNTFLAIPWPVLYRPPLRHAKSRICGSQTARVTGPPGEEIYCDEYGRVKVQFHWDRHGALDDQSSCWLRVSSSWAGDHHGSVTVPRVGMEVLVTFLEGDPDQPVISGCLSNALTLPAHTLPDHKTRSVFRSRSTPGGDGYNELHIEDKAGAELIYLRAQRDMEQQIERNSHLQVSGERHETVIGNSVSVLQAEDQRTVSADRKVDLQSCDYLQVADSSHTRVGQTLVVEAGQQVHLKAGASVVLDGGASITLKAGGQHIVIGPGGIFSSSEILLGGSPVPGLPAASVLPGMLAELTAAPLPAMAIPDPQGYQRQAVAGALLPICGCAQGAEGRCPVHQQGAST